MKHFARVASGKLKLGVGRSSSQKDKTTADSSHVTLERASDEELLREADKSTAQRKSDL
jgi:hypothetical protein